MAIAPIGPLPPIPTLGTTTGAAGAAGPRAGGAVGVAGTTAPGGVTGSGGGFSTMLGNAIDSLNQAQSSASSLEVKTAAGQGTLANTMIAASKASLDTQVATAVMNKALAAYTTIANMAI